MRLVIKKSNIRAFLLLCAKVAAVDTKEDRKLLFLTAIKDGVFRNETEKDETKTFAYLEADDNFADYCSKICEQLVAFVRCLAGVLNSNNCFDMIIEGNKKIIHAWNSDSYQEDIGKIKFQIQPDKNESYVSSYKVTDEEIQNDDYFIPAFLHSLEEYKNKRGLQWTQIPLRICDWCSIPFFGNRYDQRFCTKLHGQRWHAERSNAQKKESMSE